jgi:hypothetical protein
MKIFELKLLSQNWIDDNPKNTTDLCSHGMIYLRINGEEILTEQDGEWQVSTSALSMLRSIFPDCNKDNPPMIQCCGMILMTGCPISVDWTVIHKNDSIILDSIYKCPTVNEEDRIYYFNEGHEIEVDKTEYVQEILCFSEAVYNFFTKSKPRSIEDKTDKKLFESFMIEFTQLIKDAKKWLINQ